MSPPNFDVRMVESMGSGIDLLIAVRTQPGLYMSIIAFTIECMGERRFMQYNKVSS